MKNLPARMFGQFVVVALLAAAPFACTAMSTYPPVDGKPISTPNVSPGPEVMAAAIKEAHRVTAPNSELVFNLPAGLAENTWNRVAYLLPEKARAMEPGDEFVYSVKQIRIMGGTAEVDVVYPEKGVYQLMTVKVNGGPLAGWSVAWAYRWLLPEQKPTPNDPLQMAEAEQANATTQKPAQKAAAVEEEDNVK